MAACRLRGARATRAGRSENLQRDGQPRPWSSRRRGRRSRSPPSRLRGRSEPIRAERDLERGRAPIRHGSSASRAMAGMAPAMRPASPRASTSFRSSCGRSRLGGRPERWRDRDLVDGTENGDDPTHTDAKGDADTTDIFDTRSSDLRTFQEISLPRRCLQRDRSVGTVRPRRDRGPSRSHAASSHAASRTLGERRAAATAPRAVCRSGLISNRTPRSGHPSQTPAYGRSCRVGRCFTSRPRSRG